MDEIRINAVMVGRGRPFGPHGEVSATQKDPVEGPVALTVLGLAGDEHKDPNHGGPDKALLHYAAEHYEMWAEHFPHLRGEGPGTRSAGLTGGGLTPGAFGENLSTRGMTEHTVCVGDRYRIGSDILVEVSQPRQPCWKLSHNAGEREIARLMQKKAAPGWYYRILELGGTGSTLSAKGAPHAAARDPGAGGENQAAGATSAPAADAADATAPLHAGMTMKLVERPNPDWPLARLIEGFYLTPLDAEFLEEATALSALGREWPMIMEKRLASGVVEDWNRRLYGPLGE